MQKLKACKFISCVLNTSIVGAKVRVRTVIVHAQIRELYSIEVRERTSNRPCSLRMP